MRWKEFRLKVNAYSGMVNSNSGDSEKLFTLNQNGCSPSTRIGVHVEPEWMFTMGRYMQNWDVLENEIRNLLGNDAKTKEKTEYGQKYEIRGIISGPTGRKAEIVTAWIILKEEKIPRLITAYPREL